MRQPHKEVFSQSKTRRRGNFLFGGLFLSFRQTGVCIDTKSLITEVAISKIFVTIYGLILFARRIRVTFTLHK